MKKIVLLIMISMLAIVPSITFGVVVKHEIANLNQSVDSVKGHSIKKVNSLLSNAGYKEPGVYVGREKGIGASYGFYLKFLNLKGERKNIKFSYDFGNYKVSYKIDTTALLPFSVTIQIAESKTNYIINFDNE